MRIVQDNAARIETLADLIRAANGAKQLCQPYRRAEPTQ
jgi:hypothetical protein